MLGSIHTDAKCPVCKGNFKLDENRNVMVCNNNHTEIAHFGKCRVFFKKTTCRFDTVRDGLEKLAFLRVQHQSGQYDPRDYAKGLPLGFQKMANRWLESRKAGHKRKTLSASTLRSYHNYMRRFVAFFGRKNIKDISAGDIEDCLFSIEGISEKTRHNHASCLRHFFTWVRRREGVPIPEFPEIIYELEFRKRTDLDTQQAILDKIKKISWDVNHKIHLGIDMLATYTNIRPMDLINCREGDIDLRNGVIILEHPTKVKNRTKTVRLIQRHIDEISRLKSEHPAHPETRFFRHIGGVQSVRPGARFGEKYFWKWWTRACESLNIKGVDLYGGTRHTTATEQARMFGKEAAKSALGNTSNKSIDRYIEMQLDGAFDVVKMTDEKRGNVVEFKRKKGSV